MSRLIMIQTFPVNLKQDNVKPYNDTNNGPELQLAESSHASYSFL